LATSTRAHIKRAMLALVALLAVSSPPAPAASAPPKCAVFLRGFSADGLAPREEYLPQMLADTVATEIAKRSGCRVTTAADVKTLVDNAADRAMCGDDSASCTAEIGQALGVDTIVDGTMRVVGDHFVVSARAMSVKEAAVLHRGEVTVDKNGDALRAAAPKIAESLFVDPAPAAAHVEDRSGLVWSGGAVLGGGALVALAGGGVALWMNTALDDPTSGRAEKESQQTMGLVGLAAVGVGAAAALVGGGLLAGGAL
jgi:TolB-like protein